MMLKKNAISILVSLLFCLAANEVSAKDVIKDSVALKDRFAEGMEASKKNAKCIKILTYYGNRFTEKNALCVIDTSIYHEIPMFAWFSNPYPISHDKYQIFLSDIYQLDTSKSNIQSDDCVFIYIVNKGVIENEFELSNSVNIKNYISIMRKHFPKPYGIPEEMIKKYDSMK